MTTIADELLNDFEDDGSENEEEQQNEGFYADAEYGDADQGANGTATAKQSTEGMELEANNDEESEDGDLEDGAPTNVKMEAEEDEEETKARVEKMELKTVSDVRNVAGLMKQLEPVMEKIEYYKNLPPEKQTKNIGSIEDNPEYKLLTQSNTLSTSIDGEIILVHKFIRDHYSVRFPELETLIQNPLEYAKTVAIIGNGPMEKIEALSESKDNILEQSLRQILDRPSLMVVTLEATRTSGEPLSEEDLASIRRACEMTVKLDRAKTMLTEYVQSRMSMFAPNLTTLIGSLTAAQLLNYTGGITGLAKTPACNLAPLGSKKSNATVGLATNTGIRHQGFLFNNEIIRDVAQDLKVQAMRILSAKIVLAARVDQAHEAPAGEQGLAFYDQVEKRIGKLSEAPPNKGVRALPAPDDKPARKRGGRRARKAKEATAMTDLRKAQNRMAFGKEEEEIGFGDSTKGMGMIGQKEDGRIRSQQIDNRTRAKLSKKNPGWGGATPAGGTATSLRGFGGGALGTSSSLKGAGLRASGVGSGLKTNVGNTGGTASTIAFTPVQGLELVDPKVRAEMGRKRAAEEDRWFSKGTFTNVGGGGGGSPAGAAPGKVDAGGFKVPALPNKKVKKNG
ncbi:U4/U6-U5 snRNP complex subunit prp31 [Saxophila tyrrhenica]|uniref:U4/U6-U5 snRNP complex subunit prp31 n=1 Tax=Saxophila tyrrhenica TaxID=1690608 RepID=A0AAV9P1T1_9PEZI|nr:U4/U6-U5 snRNP complex subunit prp31 [Saxophila tyrrhenica]